MTSTSSDTPKSSSHKISPTNTWPTSNWNGRWSDGKTAAAHKVEIELQQDNLVFRREDQPGTPPQIWPYKEIHSPHPVHPNDKSVLLTSTKNPEQRLFIDEVNFAKRILDQAPNITHSAHQWSLLKWPLAMAAALVVFWALTYFNIISPANYLAQIMPDNSRTTLGTGVIKTITKNQKVCHSQQGDAALNKLLVRLYPATPQKIKFKIKVVDLKIVNAFAAPGDHIIVSGKLIQQATSPDELAGVIAHEIGHAIERHPEAGIIRALGLLTIMQFLTAGEASAVSDIAFFLIQSGYSRSAEQQADEHAANILKKVAIDTRPLAGFFARLINRTIKTDNKDEKPTKTNPTAQPNKTENKDFLSWISTHPATQDRIEFFNRNGQPTSPPILNSPEWKALQNMCGEQKKSKPNES